jgi:uncharacterized Zn finger protein (UPF0148 family)
MPLIFQCGTCCVPLVMKEGKRYCEVCRKFFIEKLVWQLVRLDDEPETNEKIIVVRTVDPGSYFLHH